MVKITSFVQQPVRGSLLSPEPRARFDDLMGGAFSRPSSGQRILITDRADRESDAGACLPLPSLLLPTAGDPDDEGRVVAATFQAFGMFGRRPEVVTKQSPAVLSAAAFAPVSLERGVSGPAAAGPVAAPAQGDVHVSRPAATAVESRSRPAVSLSSPPDAHESEPASGETPVVVEMTPVEEKAAVAGTVRRKAVARAVGNDVNAQLTLSYTGDVAGLAVRVAGVSPEEIAQFRARARSLLAEHGLSLETLSINGEDRSERGLPVRETKQWR